MKAQSENGVTQCSACSSPIRNSARLGRYAVRLQDRYVTVAVWANVGNVRRGPPFVATLKVGSEGYSRGEEKTDKASLPSSKVKQTVTLKSLNLSRCSKANKWAFVMIWPRCETTTPVPHIVAEPDRTTTRARLCCVLVENVCLAWGG